MGRVSNSDSRPLGADQLPAEPLTTVLRAMSGPADGIARPRTVVAGPADRRMSLSVAVVSVMAGSRPVSAVRCRPGSAAAAAGRGATPARRRRPAAAGALRRSGRARPRPWPRRLLPVRVDDRRSARRLPLRARGGARRRLRWPKSRARGDDRRRERLPAPREPADVRRSLRQPATSGARRRPPDGAAAASDTTDRSRTRGRPAVAHESASARCSRREEGCRATDSSRAAASADAGSGAMARWRSGRRRVSSSVQAVSSTPPRTTRTQTWHEPSAACRQPSSSPDHQAPA